MKYFNFFAVPMICLLLYSVASYGDDNFKVGLLDFQQILKQSKTGQKIQSEIKQKRESLTSELQEKQNRIKEMQEKYKRESLVLSNEIKVQKEHEIRAELNEYQMLQNQKNQEFNKIRTELINEVTKRIVDFAQKIGKSQGYFMIIEKQSGTVLYAKDSLEITDQFIKKIDK